MSSLTAAPLTGETPGNYAAEGDLIARLGDASYEMRMGKVVSGNTRSGVLLDTSGTVITSGTGSPEGVVTANVGSIYLRRDGSATTSLYVKGSGTGNTGWITPVTGSVSTDTLFDAKGDLPVGTGADTAAKLPVGPNTQVLTADSTQATGLKWAAPGAVSDGMPVYNVVRDYGADNSGAANAATAIQNAINAANTAGGGIVYCPMGTYLLTAGLQIKTGVHLVGIRGLTVLKANAALSMISPSAATQTKWSVREVTFDFNAITVGTVLGVSFASANCDYCTVTNCEFKNYGAGTNTRVGIRSTTANKGCRFTDNYFFGPGAATNDNSYGMYLEGVVDDCRITGNNFDGCYNACALFKAGANAPVDFLIATNVIQSFGKYGIYMLGVSHGEVVGNIVKNTAYVGGAADSSGGITCGLVGTTGCSYMSIVGNTLDHAGEISAYDTEHAEIIGNTILAPQAAGIEFGVSLGTSKDVTVKANYVEGSVAGSGIFVGATTGALVEGNTSVGNANDGITMSNLVATPGTRNKIINNICRNNTQTGIAIIAFSGSAQTDHVIAGNTCTANTGVGIFISNLADIQRIRIEFNDLVGNSAPYSIGGLAAHIRKFGNITVNGDYDANTFALFQV